MTKSLPTNYQKHVSENPIQRYLLARFKKAVIGELVSIQPTSLLDVGCGEGFMLDEITRNRIAKKHVGIDMSRDALEIGHRLFPALDLQRGDVYHMKFPDRSFDIVLCLEVLEHLEHPQAAIDEIMRVSAGWMLFSVPHEPWFQLANFARGKYFSTWGNHPEHINHWSASSFVTLLKDKGLHVVGVHLPFPWTVVLAKKETLR